MLLDIAREALRTISVANLTIQDIARRARVHAALIHYYFRNKRGLILALVDDFVARLEQRLAEPIQEPVTSARALRTVAGRYAMLLAGEPYISSLALEALARPSVADVQLGNAVADALRAHVEQGMVAMAPGAEQSGFELGRAARDLTAHILLATALVIADASLAPEARDAELDRAVARLADGFLSSDPTSGR